MWRAGVYAATISLGSGLHSSQDLSDIVVNRRRFREELSSILLRQLVVDHAGAVHLQPCIRALTGRSEEFRGFVLNGAPFL